MTKYLYIIILILLGLLIFTCNRNIEEVKQVIKTDTLITSKKDTLWIKDTIVKFKYIRKNPTLVYKDSIKTDDSVRIYRNYYNDSNITINSLDSIRGKLISNSTNYILKVPVKIIDSIFVNTDKLEVVKPKRKIYMGISTQFYPIKPHIYPMLLYQDRRDRVYYVQYDILNSGISIGFSKKIRLFNR